MEERRRIRTEKEKIGLDFMSTGLSGYNDCGSMDSIILALRTADAIDILEKSYTSLRLSGTIVVYSAIQMVTVFNN